MSRSSSATPGARSRAPETLADYLVVAICPTLIFFFVGSLMWFLVEVFYHGEFKGRLLWVMAMWVMGIVGIARISMEEGRAYAALFAAPLGGAVAMAMTRFVNDGLVVGSLLMVLVWWAAHKLVWDATLIDDTQDASGEGLLQQMGWEDEGDPSERSSNPPAARSSADRPPAETNDPPATVPWWETLLAYDHRPHAPGIWVVYFSLAALPIFGIGGWFVSSGDPVARARTFGLLVVYVASGMGLLLATSFLGLRRYLRQRKLQMPLEMTSTWLVAGVVLICAMLLLAAILPRPRREQSLSQLPQIVTSAARKASRLAFGKEGTKDNDTQDAAKTTSEQAESKTASGEAQNKGSEPSQQPGGKKGQTSQGKSEGKSQGKGQGKGQAKSQGNSGSNDSTAAKNQNSSEPKSKGKASDQSAEAKNQPDQQRDQQSDQQNQDSHQDQPPEQQPNQPPPDQQPPDQQSSSETKPRSPAEFLSQAPAALLRHLGIALRWLFYAALLVGLIVAAVVYRHELAAAIRKLLDELRELWASWFGAKKPAGAAGEPIAPLPPPRGFATYPDPYLTGSAARMTWPELVRYTFEALEAWGRDQACARAQGQTAQEFALALAAVDSDVHRQAVALAAHYNQLAYAPPTGGKGPKQSLRELWNLLAERCRHAAAL